MEIKTIYNHFTKRDMYVGANGRLFETRIEAIDDIESATARYYEDLEYLSKELFNKTYNELTIREYEDVYHEYSKK